MKLNTKKFINKLNDICSKLGDDCTVDIKSSKNYKARIYLVRFNRREEYVLTSAIYSPDESDHLIAIQFDFDFTDNEGLFVFNVSYRSMIDEFGFIKNALENNGLDKTESKDQGKSVYRKISNMDCDNKKADDYIKRIESLTTKFLDYLEYVKTMRE